MLKIGLTGGIGSGKSSVSKLFQEWGTYVFDADSVAKEVLEKLIAKGWKKAEEDSTKKKAKTANP